MAIEESKVVLTATESLKTVDILVITTAAVSMIILAITLLLIVYIFYRVREDVTLFNELKMKTSRLEKKNEEGDYISDQITNVLYDLYSLVSSLKSVHELSLLGYDVDERLLDAMEKDVLLTEKHFAEIGLLSIDKERRISAQQSLANLSGDFDSLRVMRNIVEKKYGIYDAEIVNSIRQLEQRVSRIVVSSSTWTGRPSGGSF